MQLLGRDHTTFYQTYETDSASILLDRPVVTLIAAVFPDPLNDYGKKGITPSLPALNFSTAAALDFIIAFVLST